jgi:nitrite reductase (NADH) small subunit
MSELASGMGPSGPAEGQGAGNMTRVCELAALTPDRGVAALVDGTPVAVFRLSPDDEVVAIGNVDPFSGASVLSRGIVGSRGDVVTVASPVYKQRFDLHTGRCVDDETVAVPTYGVRVVDGWVEVTA